MLQLVLSRPAKRCPLNSENPPLENCLLKSEILPKIRIETTENIFLDTKNAFLAAREDTKTNVLSVMCLTTTKKLPAHRFKDDYTSRAFIIVLCGGRPSSIVLVSRKLTRKESKENNKYRAQS